MCHFHRTACLMVNFSIFISVLENERLSDERSGLECISVSACYIGLLYRLGLVE